MRALIAILLSIAVASPVLAADGHDKMNSKKSASSTPDRSGPMRRPSIKRDGNYVSVPSPSTTWSYNGNGGTGKSGKSGVSSFNKSKDAKSRARRASHFAAKAERRARAKRD